MLAASVCARCGQGFSNRQQLGAHVRCCRAAAAAASDDDADLFSADNTQVIATPTPTVPQRQISLYTLCRREKSPWGTVTPSDVTFDTQASVQASVFSRDYRPVQQLWSEHVQKAYVSCYPHFWKVHETLRTQTATCRDTVLSVVKDLIGERARGHRWPRSSRSLRDRVLKFAGPFWDAVTTTHYIDMKKFGLPGVPDTLKFSLIDPVYMWITRCNALHDAGIPLQWDAAHLHHPVTGEEVFGAGIQYSAFLRKAQYDIGRSGRVAAFNVNWDGGLTGFGARSCIPIHVQVTTLRRSITLYVYLYVVYVAKLHPTSNSDTLRRKYMTSTSLSCTLRKNPHPNPRAGYEH